MNPALGGYTNPNDPSNFTTRFSEEQGGAPMLPQLQGNTLNFLMNRFLPDFRPFRIEACQQGPSESHWDFQSQQQQSLEVYQAYDLRFAQAKKMLLSTTNLALVQKMMLISEKSASHCLRWMNHDQKIVVGTSKGQVYIIKAQSYLDPTRDQDKLREIKRVHDNSISAMEFNKKGNYLITGDKKGFLKYLKTKISYENTINKKTSFDNDPLRHQEAIRSITVAPSDLKFMTCSDDKTIRLYDFERT